jgi:hypothetical protein
VVWFFMGVFGRCGVWVWDVERGLTSFTSLTVCLGLWFVLRGLPGGQGPGDGFRGLVWRDCAFELCLAFGIIAGFTKAECGGKWGMAAPRVGGACGEDRVWVGFWCSAFWVLWEIYQVPMRRRSSQGLTWEWI